MQGSRIAHGAFRARAAVAGGARGLRLMPRSGPSAGAIKGGSRDTELGMHVVDVTPAVAAASRSSETLGFGSELRQRARCSRPTPSAPATPSRCRSGRTSTPGSWSASARRRPTLEALQVDQKGDIFVPYAGAVHAAGQSPDQLREEITAEPRRPDARPAGRGAPRRRRRRHGQRDGRRARRRGSIPIEAPTLPALVDAGAGRRRRRSCPTWRRSRSSAAASTGRIWLQDLYDNPRYDIALRGGDRIIVEEDRRSFTALGATRRPGARAVQQARHDRDRGDRHASAASTAAPPTRAASSSSATSRPRSPTACSAAPTSSVRSAWPTCST